MTQTRSQRQAETLLLAPADELDIDKTFSCGQCFRWNRDADGVYTGVVRGYGARVWQENGRVYIRSKAPSALWRDYFDLERDYSAISRFEAGEYLARCIDCGRGIRILRQEPWEALCSFIISQCNHIPRIKGIVERLCSLFGEPVELDGQQFFAFPPAERIAALATEDLAPIHSGYRAAYIIDAARSVASGRLDLDKLIAMSSTEAKKALMCVNGVGEKVANCVILFGLRHMEAFPVDVWIRRALKEHFPPDFDPESLGEYAGLAQQYIFFYARGGGA